MSGGLFAKALLRETGRELDPGTTARLQQFHVEASLRRIEQVRPLPGAKQLLGHLTEAHIHGASQPAAEERQPRMLSRYWASPAT